MKDNMDIILEAALQPNILPDTDLNEKIIAMSVATGKQNTTSTVLRLARVAAIFLIVICVGSVSVYAAGKLIKKVFVTDHTISVGNPDYVDDAVVAMDEEMVDVKDKSHEDGDGSVRWLTKDVQVVGGYTTNTYYTYKDYATAILDTGLHNWFHEVVGDVESITYVLSENEDFTEKSINASYYYHDGSFQVSENVVTGNIASDVANSITLKNTDNVREYTSVSGYEFTLVDQIMESEDGVITTTFVMIAYDDYYGYISFDNLSDEEIKSILDTVIIP